MNHIAPVFILSAIFGGIALIIHIIVNGRIKSKILESGKLEFDPQLAKLLFNKNEGSINNLKWGILTFFTGLGFLINHYLTDQDAPILFLAIESICISTGFMLYFLVQKTMKS